MSNSVISISEKDTVWKGVGFALLATLLWSGNFIVARALHKSIPPVSLAFFRWSVATIILFPIAFQKIKKEWKLLQTHLLYLSLVALTGVTLFNTFVYIAGQYTSATNMALIGTTTSPIFVLLITGLFLKQKILWNQVAGAAICIFGISVLLLKGSFAALHTFAFTTGDLWILAGAFSFAIYTVLVRRKPKELSATPFLFSAFFLGMLFLVPAYLIERSYVATFDWNATIILVFLYLGAGASVISFLCWNCSIKTIGAARTSLFGNLIPVFSAIEATMLLNESFSWVVVVSLFIILLGLIVANLNLFWKFKVNN